MKTNEIAMRLVELCREGRNDEALKMYAPDAQSVEAMAPPGGSRESIGLDAIKAKGEWWVGAHEVHSAKLTGPWPLDDRFIVGFNYDITEKASGQRMTMDEVALYTVKDGKIVREEFFYQTGG